MWWIFVFAFAIDSAYARMRTIGGVLSQAKLEPNETTLFEHTVSGSDVGTMTHFWTAGDIAVDFAIFRYYVDGETTPSIEFQVNLACGVGFDDQTAPWGTKWMGKGAKSTGWFHNFRIPFQSIKVTFMANPATTRPQSAPTIWTIVRGVENLPVEIGGVRVPDTARLRLIKNSVTNLPALDFYEFFSIPSGSGMVFMTSASVASGTENFMEGCHHFYSPVNATWPGVPMSTGMEDYYDSAFYFNGGGFHLPVSGTTHLVNTGSSWEWSGYRFHEMDPVLFTGGARLQWRNGDVTDPATGLKCTLDKGQGGTPCGDPRPSNISSYAWVYTWV